MRPERGQLAKRLRAFRAVATSSLACEPLLGTTDGRMIFESMIHALHQRPAALAA